MCSRLQGFEGAYEAYFYGQNVRRNLQIGIPKAGTISASLTDAKLVEVTIDSNTFVVHASEVAVKPGVFQVSHSMVKHLLTKAMHPTPVPKR